MATPTHRAARNTPGMHRRGGAFGDDFAGLARAPGLLEADFHRRWERQRSRREDPLRNVPARGEASAQAVTDDAREPLVADEPLLEVARLQPVRAARFLEAVLLSGSILGVVLPLPCLAFFFSEQWAACGTCSRPLHVWVLINCLLHFLQSPLRLFLLRRLRQHAGITGAGLEAKVRQLTSCRAWRLSTALSTAAYAWFVVGVVWILNADFCRPCPDLYRMTLYVMGVAIMKPILTLAAFRAAFGRLRVAAGDADREAREAPRGAGEELIASLPLEAFSQEHSISEGPCSCAVCLCDFEGGDLRRRLPCGHKFHKACIDTWLRRNRVCPLCLHDASAPPPRRAPHRGAAEGVAPRRRFLWTTDASPG